MNFLELMKEQRWGALFLAGLLASGIILISSSLLIKQNIGDVSQYWLRFTQENSQKMQLVIALRSELGYGGMIHNLKNYILRGEEKYYIKAREKLGSTASILSNYQSLSVNPAELEALDQLSQTIDSYRNALDRAHLMLQSRREVSKVDRFTRVSDLQALKALSFLSESAQPSKRLKTKQTIISDFRETIGYGGLIHNFKNFVLRGDDSLRDVIETDLRTATETLDTYEALTLNAIEHEALFELRQMIENYAQAFAKAKSFAHQGLSPRSIDTQVVVNDTPALTALASILRQNNKNSEDRASSVAASIKETWALINTIFFLTTLLIAALIWAAIATMKERHNKNETLKASIKRAKDALRELSFQKFALDEHAIVSITDIDGNITYVNEKFCTINGYKEHELLGQNHRLLKSNEHPEDFFTEMWDTITAGQPWHGEIKNHNKSGENYWVTTTIVPTLDETGKLFQFVSIRTDITEKKNTQKLLESNISKLEKAKLDLESQAETLTSLADEKSVLSHKLQQEIDEKNRLFSIISHDLRSPFNILLGMTGLMTEMAGNLSKDQVIDYANDVHEAGERAFDLVENLLHWARLQMEGHQPVPQHIKIADLYLDCVDILTPNAKDKNIDLSHDLGELHIYADIDMVKTILRNLTANAIKFTAENGSIIFNAKKSETGVTVSIIDTGVGMSEQQISEVFLLDVKTSTPGTNGETGTGLGLPLCKEMIERNGGHIWIESVEGEGSQFHFTLPASPSE